MKLLIFACLLGYAAASFLQEAAPVVDDSILAFLKGTSDVGSLREVLGSDDPMLDDVEDDIKTELGKALKEALEEFLKRMKDEVDHGKTAAKDLVEKVEDLRQKLKDSGLQVGDKAEEMISHVKQKAKEILRKLMEHLGIGKKNLDHTMDAVARMKFSDLVEKIREKILSNETIQKIRDYFRRLENGNPVVQKLKEFLEELRDADIREILHHLLEYRPERNTKALRGEPWDKIKECFKNLKIKVSKHPEKLSDWLKEVWNKGLEKIKDKHAALRAIALEYISHAKDLHAEIAREVLEFLAQYKEDLGDLWKQIVDAAKEAIGKF